MIKITGFADTMGGGIAKGNRILFNVSGFSFDSSGSLLLSEVKLIEKPQFKIGDKVKCIPSTSIFHSK